MTGGHGEGQRARSLALVLLTLLLGALAVTATPGTAKAAVLPASTATAHCDAPAASDCSQQLTSSDHVAVIAVRQVRRDVTPRPLPPLTREPATLPTGQGWYAHASHPRPPTVVQHDPAPSLSRRGPPAPAEH